MVGGSGESSEVQGESALTSLLKIKGAVSFLAAAGGEMRILNLPDAVRDIHAVYEGTREEFINAVSGLAVGGGRLRVKGITEELGGHAFQVTMAQAALLGRDDPVRVSLLAKMSRGEHAGVRKELVEEQKRRGGKGAKVLFVEDERGSISVPIAMADGEFIITSRERALLTGEDLEKMWARFKSSFERADVVGLLSLKSPVVPFILQKLEDGGLRLKKGAFIFVDASFSSDMKENEEFAARLGRMGSIRKAGKADFIFSANEKESLGFGRILGEAATAEEGAANIFGIAGVPVLSHSARWVKFIGVERAEEPSLPVKVARPWGAGSVLEGGFSLALALRKKLSGKVAITLEDCMRLGILMAAYRINRVGYGGFDELFEFLLDKNAWRGEFGGILGKHVSRAREMAGEDSGERTRMAIEAIKGKQSTKTPSWKRGGGTLKADLKQPR